MGIEVFNFFQLENEELEFRLPETENCEFKVVVFSVDFEEKDDTLRKL